jgi:hypothetical protein
MRWNDDFAIGRFLNGVRAEYRQGDVLAPCPLAAENHPAGSEDHYKVVLSRGDSFPLLLFCRTCRHAASTKIWHQWGLKKATVQQWFDEADNGGYFPFEDAVPLPPLPPLGTLDAAYGVTLLSNPVSNSAEALEWLAARGVSDELADSLQYGWFPGGEEWGEATIEEAALHLAELEADCDISEVPGFNHYTDLRGPAIAVPCRAENGMIHGIKLRLLLPGKFRGRQLSSQKSRGARARAGLHFAGRPAAEKKLIITEGERKADLTRHWAGDAAAVLSVPGVGNLRLLSEWLAERAVPMGIKSVALAFDQDAAGAAATAAVAEAVRLTLEVEPELLRWEGKGIDDAIAKGSEISSVPRVAGFPHTHWQLSDAKGRLSLSWTTVEAVLKKGPIRAAELYRLYPQHENRCRAMVARGELSLRKVVGIGPVMMHPELSEEAWDQWLAATKKSPVTEAVCS